jgi:AbrB family looped-hinge helix DNA binding protein
MQVTVSSKFQIVIPREIRKVMKITPGEKIELIPYENRLEAIPLRNVGDMRGFVKGIDTSVEREDDRL